MKRTFFTLGTLLLCGAAVASGCGGEPDEVLPLACADGQACDDGDPCTLDDVCQAGSCAGELMACDDNERCTTDRCEAGSCVYEPNSDACDDGEACTIDDVCSAGTCRGTPFDDAPCDDGNGCTFNDRCGGGICEGNRVTCVSFDPCKASYCDPNVGDCVSEEYAGGCPELASTLVNEYRDVMGLEPLELDSNASTAAQNHCDYFVAHPELYPVEGFNGHYEWPEYDGFTGYGFTDRMHNAGFDGFAFSEVMDFVGRPQWAVERWIGTLYHRVPFTIPRANEMGYGWATGSGPLNCDVIDFGRHTETTPELDGMTVPFPVDGMTGVPTSWDGLETPQPPLPAGVSYPTGPVITLSFGTRDFFAETVLIESSLRDQHGVDVPHVAADQGDDVHLKYGTLSVIPHDPLTAYTTYTVKLRWFRYYKAPLEDDPPYEASFEWSFTTADSSKKYFDVFEIAAGQAGRD